MVHFKLKKHKGNYEVNAFHSEGSKSHYSNLITKDPNRIAQILIDLQFDGFPIEKAVKIFLKKVKTRDWTSF